MQFWARLLAERARVSTAFHRQEMALQECRQTRNLTLPQSADVLNVHQAAETMIKAGTQKPADMRVSTLRRVLSAMGAKLKITAQFPDGEVVLNLFDHVETRAG